MTTNDDDMARGHRMGLGRVGTAASIPVSATPGPWTVETGVCSRDHPDTSADVISADGHVVVANCGCHPAAIANARLIAAAPELLEACRRLLKFNKELCEDELQRGAGRGVGVSAHYPSAGFARAALAKAEGR